jgi:hypothetical protein
MTVSGREDLVATVVSAVDARACWERAQDHLVLGSLVERLGELGVEVTPAVAVALMGAAMLLAEGTEEFGGDARDVLGDLAALGLALLEEADSAGR